MFFHIEGNEEACCNCENYLQHYTKVGNMGFIACNYGYCIYQKARSRKPGSRICKNFERREDK